MRNLSLFVFFLVLGLFLNAQTPCEDGFAGEYPCDGYDLLTHYPLEAVGGGENGADVWWSSNGANWTLATLSAPWPNRQISAALTFDGKLWLVGGYKALNESMKKEAMTDVWYSADGSEWQASTLNAQWGPRYGAQALVFKNRFACTLTVSC